MGLRGWCAGFASHLIICTYSVLFSIMHLRNKPPIICLYVLDSVLLCPLQFPHKNDVLFVFTSSCLQKGSCLIYVISVCLVRLYLQLFVGGLMSYLRYLCLFGSSLSPVVLRKVHVLFTLFVFVWFVFIIMISCSCLIYVICVCLVRLYLQLF